MIVKTALALVGLAVVLAFLAGMSILLDRIGKDEHENRNR